MKSRIIKVYANFTWPVLTSGAEGVAAGMGVTVPIAYPPKADGVTMSSGVLPEISPPERVGKSTAVVADAHDAL
jgi:hypothetical protein